MTQRVQFEAWAAARGWSTRRHEGRNNNAYMDLRTKSAWAGACWRSNEYKPAQQRDCTSCPMQPVMEGCCSANLGVPDGRDPT